MTTIYGPADMPGANPYCPDGQAVGAPADLARTLAATTPGEVDQ